MFVSALLFVRRSIYPSAAFTLSRGIMFVSILLSVRRSIQPSVSDIYCILIKFYLHIYILLEIIYMYILLRKKSQFNFFLELITKYFLNAFHY